ncbi:YkgJ family cysteine cluster protein [Uliginosibacterium aquaticum]|uniref:YkgJ family cysteine cluster protein n=1 Tax=Uliginosibacterium aquaticum TaxID=2731212 RepID=A0ABX2ILV6_9RHOO|nr:YkgJ family cysteine cluster protein [Uliginosibacterium aquaticum]NSL55301.1 YkgJ family cysteine cluster protein [Uliginosibacterium aquaticum]
MSDSINPCIRCGACCCSFRVSFYWGESDDAPGGYVPHALTVQVTSTLSAMQGTHPVVTRCVALAGEPGRDVGCTIYPNRPAVCREFAAWQDDGLPDPRCTAARERIGLAALPALSHDTSEAG